MKFFQENFLHAKKKGMIIQMLDFISSTLHFQCVTIFSFNLCKQFKDYH